MNTSRQTIFLLIIITISLLLSACTQRNEQDTVTLKIAVLPILDTLPLYVANQEGYYQEHNVSVEFIPVSSGPERDQIIAAGKADGMINELVSALFYNQETVEIQVIRFARVATHEYPVFRILSAKDSGISSIDDLKGIEIGISEGTVIEYLTDRLLQAQGFSAEEIKSIAVPKIPDRLALLNSGGLKAAMLPDPLSSLAIQNGATVIIDDTSYPEFSHSVISFRKSVIDEHPEAIKGFLAALEDAITEINQDPSQWNELLVEKGLIPPPVMGSYQMPKFPEASVPTQAQWDDVVAWAIENSLISGDPVYKETITDRYLP